MIDFILDNLVLIMIGVFFLKEIVDVYRMYFGRVDSQDTWLQDTFAYEMMRKGAKKHPGLVGAKIKLSADTHVVDVDSEGNYFRREKA